MGRFNLIDGVLIQDSQNPTLVWNLTAILSVAEPTSEGMDVLKSEIKDGVVIYNWHVYLAKEDENNFTPQERVEFYRVITKALQSRRIATLYREFLRDNPLATPQDLWQRAKVAVEVLEFNSCAGLV